MNVASYRQESSLLKKLPVFFQPWWLDIVYPSWSIAITKSKDGNIAVWPYQLEKKGGIKIIRNPFLTPYQGPYIAYQNIAAKNYKRYNIQEQFIAELWKQLPKADVYDIFCSPNNTEHLFFQQKGFTVQPRTTYYLALNNSYAELLANFNSDHKQRIKQAEPIHTIKEGKKYIDQLHRLHEYVFSRKNKNYPYSKATLAQLVTAAYENNSGMLWVAEDEKKEITSAAYVVWDSETMYLLVTGTHTENAHPGALRLLITHAIQHALQLGLQYFDFEGSSDPGIEPFFRRFGGERKHYFLLQKNDSWIWKLKRQFLG